MLCKNVKRKENLIEDPRSFYQLTDGEKVQYIVDTYFMGPEVRQNQDQVKKDNKYINSLPESSQCKDNYDKCKEWAENGECTINPEFMLYGCPGSCKACALSEQEKFNLVKIYNKREPSHCVFHGESYPDPYKYLRKTEEYN